MFQSRLTKRLRLVIEEILSAFKIKCHFKNLVCIPFFPHHPITTASFQHVSVHSNGEIKQKHHCGALPTPEMLSRQTLCFSKMLTVSTEKKKISWNRSCACFLEIPKKLKHVGFRAMSILWGDLCPFQL